MSRESEIMLRLIQMFLVISTFMYGMIVGVELYKSTHNKYDVNGDGEVTITDAVIVLNEYLNAPYTIPVADTDEEGNVSIHVLEG